MVKSQTGDTNIFNLSDPMAYRCQILHYHSRLSRLYISVYQGQKDIPAFYFLFSDVAYIDAPVSWQGADFSIAESQRCIDLMLERALIGPAILQFPDAYASITAHAKLYTGRTFGPPIRLIAASAAMLQKIPDPLL